MGNCATTEPDSSLPPQTHSFKKLYAIGQGTYGKVWKVSHDPTLHLYAMKEMNKVLILSKKSVTSIMNERKFLAALHNPFIVNMHYAFQDRDSLYLVLDLMAGGDLRYHLSKVTNLSEQSTKFMTACIVASLEYLFLNRIIHRDLKPENLVFDANGYLHLTDFGIARTTEMDNIGLTSGSVGYMAPETVCLQNQSHATDYFALGVIVFEALTGRRPYCGTNRKEMREEILAKQVKLPQEQWSDEVKDFADRLLQRKPEKRLGFGGIEEIKRHQWFDGFDWEELYGKELISPFKIEEGDNFDWKQVAETFVCPKNRLSERVDAKMYSRFNYSSLKVL